MNLILAEVSTSDPDTVSPRLLATLSSADVIAATDSVRIGHFLGAIGIEPADRTVSSLREAASHFGEPRAGQESSGGADPTVVAIADRGVATAEVTRGAIGRGVAVSVVPGPNPVIAALAMSGLATDRFCFEGRLSRHPEARRATLAALAAESRTLVFDLEPGQREATVAAMAEAFGSDRSAALCRGLTRSGDQIRRARLGELVGRCGEERDEATLLVVAGADPTPIQAPPPDGLASAVADLVATGMASKAAIREVATRFELPKRVVYDAVVTHKSR